MPANSVDLFLNIKGKDNTGPLFDALDAQMEKQEAKADAKSKSNLSKLSAVAAKQAGSLIGSMAPVMGTFTALFGDVQKLEGEFTGMLFSVEAKAEQLGLTLKESMTLTAAADHLATQLDTVGANGQKAVDALIALNINGIELRKLGEPSQLGLIAKQLGTIESATERADIAQRLLGDSYAEVLQTVDDGFIKTGEEMHRVTVGIDRAFETSQQMIANSQKRLADFLDIPKKNAVIAWAPFRAAVNDTFAELIEKTWSWQTVNQKVVDAVSGAFEFLLRGIDKVKMGYELFMLGVEKMVIKTQKLVASAPLVGDQTEALRLADELLAVELEIARVRKDGIKGGSADRFAENRRRRQAELDDLQTGSDGLSSDDNALSDLTDKDYVGELLRKRQELAARQAIIDEKARKDAERAEKEARDKWHAEQMAWSTAAFDKMAEVKNAKIKKQLGVEAELWELNAGLAFINSSEEDFEKRNQQACMLIENAGKVQIDCMQAVKDRIEELEKNRQVKMIQSQADALSGGVDLFNSFEALANAGSDAEDARLQKRLDRLSTEKQALIDSYANKENLTKAEVATYQEKMRGIMAAEDRINAQRASNEEKARKSAKRSAVLNAISATASAYAAAVSALNTPSPDPFTKFAAYSSVLATGLAGVAKIKDACAQIGGGGEGAAGGGAAGGAAGGGGAGGSGSQSNITDFQPPEEETKPTLNLTLEGSGRYTADEVMRIVDALNFFDVATINSNRVAA